MNTLGPLLAIRADASNRIGTGHVLRTLAIATEWQRRGGEVVYLCADLTEGLRQRLLACGCRIEGVNAGNDAADSARMAGETKASVLLVDHYGLGEDWWAKLPATRRWVSAALNDFAEPLHRQADVMVSPRASVIAGEALSGPAFLLIREEIRRAVPPLDPCPEAQRVLLVMGGADPQNAGPGIAKAALQAAPGVSVRVIVGPAANNLALFQGVSMTEQGFEIIQSPATMLPHFEWADTVIVSPSTVAFEALHHGLVTGLVLIADNQLEICRDLVEMGSAVLLADARTPGNPMDLGAFKTLVSDSARRCAMVSVGSALVDGSGAARVCDALGLPEIFFRPVTSDDARMTWHWANDPETRRASFSNAEIPWETHAAWFERRCRMQDPCWLAIDTQGAPLAFVRFDFAEENHATISINLAPERRGKNLSALIIASACERLREKFSRTVIHAWIKITNVASQRSFAKAGFHEIDSPAQDRKLFILPP